MLVWCLSELPAANCRRDIALAGAHKAHLEGVSVKAFSTSRVSLIPLFHLFFLFFHHTSINKLLLARVDGFSQVFDLIGTTQGLPQRR